jgi:hypothetical protein
LRIGWERVVDFLCSLCGGKYQGRTWESQKNFWEIDLDG